MPVVAVRLSDGSPGPLPSGARAPCSVLPHSPGRSGRPAEYGESDGVSLLRQILKNTVASALPFLMGHLPWRKPAACRGDSE